ncbi:MAG: hypothetical protein ACKO4A_04090, partial [Gammaproteobacteria bacterium]
MRLAVDAKPLVFARRAFQRALPPATREWLGSAVRKNTYTLVQDADSGSAFAVVGDDRPVEHFARVYLEASSYRSAR